MPKKNFVATSLPNSGRLECRYHSGDPEGWGRYECTYTPPSGRSQKFHVEHNYSSGNWALLATASAVLAEAGISQVPQTPQTPSSNPEA